MGREDAVSKLIRESENLPEQNNPFVPARLGWIERVVL
jgi:hypothetical protein